MEGLASNSSGNRDNFPVNDGKVQDAWKVPEEAKKEAGDRDAI